MTLAVALVLVAVLAVGAVALARRTSTGRHAPRYVARHRHPSAGRARRRDAPHRGRVSWPSDAPTNPEE